jgi:hypothetical protein
VVAAMARELPSRYEVMIADELAAWCTSVSSSNAMSAPESTSVIDIELVPLIAKLVNAEPLVNPSQRASNGFQGGLWAFKRNRARANNPSKEQIPGFNPGRTHHVDGQGHLILGTDSTGTPNSTRGKNLYNSRHK